MFTRIIVWFNIDHISNVGGALSWTVVRSREFRATDARRKNDVNFRKPDWKINIDTASFAFSMDLLFRAKN